jgi:hypothetical protein
MLRQTIFLGTNSKIRFVIKRIRALVTEGGRYIDNMIFIYLITAHRPITKYYPHDKSKNLSHNFKSLNIHRIVIRLAKREERSIIQNLHNG